MIFLRYSEIIAMCYSSLAYATINQQFSALHSEETPYELIFFETRTFYYYPEENLMKQAVSYHDRMAFR